MADGNDRAILSALSTGMRRAALIAVFAAVLGGLGAPAKAAEAGAPSPDADRSVTLATVALPLVFNGQVVNYIFVSVKLLLTPSADSTLLRDKEPFFRDALVRAGSRTPFVKAGDYNHLNDAMMKAALFREATAIAGPGKIAGIAILSETAEHRRATPQAAHGAPVEP
jgi:hypothetical protein